MIQSPNPPCQRFSKAVKIKNRTNHADFLNTTRLILKSTHKPYVIENVPTAPLKEPFILCGSFFGLPIRRHRKFESNIFILVPLCSHNEYEPKYPPAWNRTNKLRVLSISGGYQTRKDIGEDFLEQHKKAMGVDWEISYKELSEAIPPAYTEYIGKYLMAEVLRSNWRG